MTPGRAAGRDGGAWNTAWDIARRAASRMRCADGRRPSPRRRPAGDPVLLLRAMERGPKSGRGPGHTDHRRPSDLRRAGQRGRMGQQGMFLLDAREGRRWSRACLPTISPRRDSSGETRCSTGRRWRGRDSGSGSRGWAVERLFDLIRIDHFRGFDACWTVPAGEPTAERGAWVDAPGEKLFEWLERELGTLPLIAEDLGVITPGVHALRERFGFPGMRILQFAFDAGEAGTLERRQPLPPPQPQPRLGGVHGHARQRHDPGLVRGQDPRGAGVHGQLCPAHGSRDRVAFHPHGLCLGVQRSPSSLCRMCWGWEPRRE